MKVIHLSDIHIGLVGNKERFSSIVDWVIDNKALHDAKVVLITGDIVQDGFKWQFEQAQPIIEKLRGAGFTVLTLPGNHDYGKKGVSENFNSVKMFKDYISGDVDYPHRVIINDCVFILLDSMLQEMREYEIPGAQGKLGREQLNKLDEILNDIEENHSSMKVVVAMHHHPFLFGRPFSRNRFLALRDAVSFKEKIIDKNKGDYRVDCLLFGHKHVEFESTSTVNSSESDKYNIGVIYGSGACTERHSSKELLVPVIDINASEVIKHFIV